MTQANAAIVTAGGSAMGADAARHLARIPMGRYGRIGEVSEAIAFVATDRASSVTGQNIRVDGGITRSA